MARYRSRNLNEETYSYESSGSGYSVSYYQTLEEMYDENHGDFKTPNLMSSLKTDTYAGSWESQYNGGVIKYNNWPDVPNPHLYLGIDLSNMTTSEINAFGSLGQGKTAVSKPVVRLPVAIAEFKEIPLLVLTAGRNYIRQLASANIKVNFGILPMARDLTSILEFTSHVDKKVAELRASLSSGGLKRTYRAPDDDIINASSYSWNSPFTGATMLVSGDVHTKTWFSAHYRPSANQLERMPKDEESLRAYARKLVTGTHFSQTLSNVWEAVPWSWLIDWFANVGDTLNSFESQYHLTIERGCVMRTKQLKVSSQITYQAQYPGWTEIYTPKEYSRTIKERNLYLGTPELTLSIPMLTNRQIGILSSLYILRSRVYR